MKKKILKSLILLLFIIVLNIVFSNKIYATEEIATGSAGDNITWLLDSDGVLTLTGSGKMTNGSASPWVDYQDQVKSVVIDENITSIGQYAFRYNTNLTEFDIPSNITSLGVGAFAYCTNLESITFSGKGFTINSSCFYQCTNLKTVELKSSTVLYIRICAFADCSSLEKIVIDAENCSIGDSSNSWDYTTIYENAVIYGYKYTSSYYYARNYGRTFVDLATGEESTETFTNENFLATLPTTNVQNYAPSQVVIASSLNHVLLGYSTHYGIETDTSCDDWQAVVSKVEEITEGCSTDAEKAKAIEYWVYMNVDYAYYTFATTTTSSLYYYFNQIIENGSVDGGCTVYTVLTNYMLYICGIPTAIVQSTGHMWTAAYIDGQWIYMDTTGCIYNGSYKSAIRITFAYEGLIYVIDDPLEGPYVTGIAQSEDDVDELTSFTIPTSSYMKGIYSTAFDSNLTLIAETGTIGAEFIKENRACVQTLNNQVIGRENHSYETVIEGNYKITRCENCGDISSKVEVNNSPSEDSDNNTFSFTDVSSDSWYYEYVEYCYENGIMTGYEGTTLFGPNDNVKRGALALIIYRMAGSPEVSSTSKFTDVQDENKYYYDAIIWASENGIVTGYGETGLFKPEATITRQELATMLYRYAKYEGKTIIENGNYTTFSDAGEVLNYAISPLNWAIGVGIISGYTDTNTLVPTGNATRAQVATMIMRYCTNL